MQFVTLTKADSEFLSYLRGTFSRELRAIPVESFGISSSRERVTFRLTPKGEIQRPLMAWVLLKAIRPEFLHLTFGPALATAAALASAGAEIHFDALGLSLLALLFFHAAAFLFNDYNDHMQGIDRIQRRRGSQVIQRGWLTAHAVGLGAMLALALACLTGAPLLFSNAQELPLIALVGFLAVVGFSFAGRGLKYQGFGDVVVFLCMGPLLTDGLAQTVSGVRSWWIGGLGAIFGLAAVVVLQLRQLESFMAERQSHAGTLVARLGFDRAKSWIAVEIFLVPIMMAVIMSAFTTWWATLAVVLFTGVICAMGIRRLLQAASPLASDICGLAVGSRQLHGLISLLVILSFLLLLLWPQLGQS